MTNPNLTEIVCIIDRSGSMSAIRGDAQGGLDSFLDQQARAPGQSRLTLVQFDDEIEVLADNVRLKPGLRYRLEPRGMTALLDALGTTINMVGRRLHLTPESERPGKVIVAIVTDGAENASQEFSSKQVKEMVTHQQEAYSWKFVYLAANQDAVLEASRFGIRREHAMNFRPEKKSVLSLYGTLSRVFSDYRTSGRDADLELPEHVEED